MALQLTRRIGETICIGEDIEITVIGVKGNQIRIDCRAPKDVPIHRKEVAERIRAQNGGQLHVGQRGAGRAMPA